MKQTLKIWALLMLFLHLSSLAIISFLPGDSTGVSFKKVCLRQENRMKVAVAATDADSFLKLFSKGAEVPESKPAVKLCSVKLFCTAATDAAVFATPYFKYHEPLFKQHAYFSITAPSEPDPPRFS